MGDLTPKTLTPKPMTRNHDPETYDPETELTPKPFVAVAPIRGRLIRLISYPGSFAVFFRFAMHRCVVRGAK